MLDLYQDQIQENLNQLKTTQDVEPGIWANFASGTRDTAMMGFAKAGRALSMALSVPAIAEDAYYGTTTARERYFKWHDEVLGRAVDYWTPKPNEVGVAGEVAGSLLSMLPMIFASPAGAVAATQLGTAEDLARKYPDVSATKANLVGAVQGAGLGLGIWMPILGQTLAQRVLVGGAGFNVLQGAVMRGVSGEILEGTKAADDFKVFDPKALTLDILLGLAFGMGAHVIPSQRQQGAEAWGKIRDWAQNLKPSEIDALMVLREGQHLNEDSLPGRPATGADVSAHVDRMRQAIDQVVTDQPIDVQNIRVQENVPRETIVDVAGPEITGKDASSVGNVEQNQIPAPDVVPGQIEPTFRDPQFTPDTERLAAAERAVTELRAEAERVRLAEGLPKPEQPIIRPPADITPLDPIEQAVAVGRHIERALLQTGMQRDEAIANAAVWEAFAKSAHERYGIPPAELMAKWGVDVRRMDSADKLLGALEQRYTQVEKPIPTETPAFKNWFGGSAVTAENGAPLRVYHGAKRLDRMGPKIDPKRATSGPMPYFTDSTDIASKYSTSKADTSLALEDATNYEKWFRIKVPGRRNPVDLDRAWFSLSPEQKAIIAERAPQITKNDDGSEIVLEPGNTRGTGGYDQHIKEARGNHFKALMEEWLTSGNLYNDEAEFLKVLKMAGMDMAKVEMHDPWAEYPGVLPVYLAIKNPLRTEEVTPELIAKLEQAVKRTRRATNETGDMWDKNRQSPKEWVEMLKGDLTKGDNSYVWTSIPDRITAELKALGYDGIIDRGGKGGGMGHTVYIPFVPGQVKSAIGNRGTFDSNNPNILYQSGPTWYSELTRQVGYLKMEQAPAKGWKDTIKGLASKGVVKPAEIEATGLNEWLDIQEGKVTKQQVQDFLAQNGVRVEEVVLGRKGQASEAMRRAIEGENNAELSFTPEQWLEQSARFERTAQSWQRNGDQNQAQRYFDLAEEANRLAEGLDPESGSTAGMPKFSQYQLPGGENYRELLLTLPNKADGVERPRVVDRGVDSDGHAKFEVYDGESFLGAFNTWSEATDYAYGYQQNKQIEGNRKQGVFQSSHFDTPNILAHIRFNERTDADGKRVLFIEEIQSDWAQKGKKSGFNVPYKPEEVKQILPDSEQGKLVGDHDRFWFFDVPDNVLQILKRDYPTAEAAREYVLGEKWREHTGVPQAPFVGKTDAWVALSMKRMIRYAAENGFDRVAWTNGEQQVSRYTSVLRKQVDAIEWTKTKDGVQLVGYKENGRPVGPAIDDGAGGVVRPTVRDKTAGRTKVVDTTEKESVLSDAIGKAMADKIKNDPAQSGVIEGADIKIDDTGMATFYDRIVPNVANDVLKKLGGGRVGEVGINAESIYERGFPSMRAAEQWGEANLGDHDFSIQGLSESEGTFAVYDEFDHKLIKGNATIQQSGFDITPALRDKAMAGMPLFQGGARGAVNFEIGKTIIALFEKADKTTFQHETGHVFLEMTKDLASRPDAPVAAMQDWATIADWLKIEGGIITREAHEQWARGWEKYLGEGVAPNEGLKRAFKRFRDWIIDVYKSLVNIDAPLNNQIRGVMARMLDSQAKDPIAKGGLEDARLQQPEFRNALEAMGREAGWDQIGGSILRERTGNEAEGMPAEGEVIGRTEWIPRAEWYARMQASAANMPGVGGQSVRRAVQKALLGEKMNAAEKRAVTWMLDEHVRAMREWDEAHAAEIQPNGDPYEYSNTLAGAGIEPNAKVVMDMALIDRAREADPDAFENIPTNFDDAQYMAAVREIVDANKPRTQETDQGRQADAGEAAQTGLASPRAQGGGDFPPPLTAAGKPEGAANNPLANEARRFAAENPDIKVNVGTDEQGQPVYKTLNEMLDDARAETELAMQDVQLFAVAAECLLGVA